VAIADRALLVEVQWEPMLSPVSHTTSPKYGTQMFMLELVNSALAGRLGALKERYRSRD